MANFNFTKRLIWLLALDIALTIGDSYIPHEWTMARAAAAVVIFMAMAVTMLVTLRRVLEEY